MSSIEIKKFIDLLEVFKKLESESYCIIKLPKNFPDYEIGSDLDVFCYDIQSVAKKILAFLQDSITSDIKMEITDNTTQLYIDLLYKNKIHFRFDLYEELPMYHNIKIKEAFFSSVIENTEVVIFKKSKIKVPTLLDELILRYIEYQEWYATRPDKIKHIDYILDKVKEYNVDDKQLFDKLYYYTALPNSFESRKVSTSGLVRNLTYFKEMGFKVIKYLKREGLNKTIKKIKEKIFK